MRSVIDCTGHGIPGAFLTIIASTALRRIIKDKNCVSLEEKMRIAIISDIHANLEAFQACLEDIDSQKADDIVSLGDNIGYGADPESVMELIKKSNIPSVLGNHELACINQKVYNWYRGDAKSSLYFTKNKLSENSMKDIRTWPVSMRRNNAFFVHGFPPDSVRHYLHQISPWVLDNTMDQMEESVCFVGHTHQMKVLFSDGTAVPKNKGRFQLDPERNHYVNVGSIGQPRENDLHASYVIWDTSLRQIDPRFVSYDNKTAAQKILDAGLPLRYAQALDPFVIE